MAGPAQAVPARRHRDGTGRPHRPSPHPPAVTGRPTLVGDFPSHLHIDLLPVAQGRGNGRRLLERLLAVLRADGSPGVHLGVSRRNVRAIGFYRALGFEELVDDDRHVVFGRRLD